MIKTATWEGDPSSIDLYDYEATTLAKDQFNVKTNGVLVRVGILLITFLQVFVILTIR